MKTYWDSSALVAACMESQVRDRLAEQGGVSRSHALTEVYSTLTGGRLGFRVDGNDAARIVRELADLIDFMDLSPAELLQALDQARSAGVRGGRVHDYLHAVAARLADCRVLLTLNTGDFDGLLQGLEIEAP